MQRDLFVLRNYFDLDEFLAHESSRSSGLDSVLGVGFYAAMPATKSAPGVEISVSPPHLKPRILDLVGKGFFAPLDEPLFFVGGSDANASMPWYLSAEAQAKGNPALCRWLLVGLLPKLLKAGHSWDEAMREALSSAFSKILELRPSAVIFLMDTELILSYLQRNGISVSEKHVQAEILHWFVEDNVHPCTALLCRKDSDFSDLVGVSREILKRAPYSNALNFHL